MQTRPSCQISLLHEGEHVWGWFQSAETSSQAAEPRGPEAAQTLLGPVRGIGLEEKMASVAFPSKDALGLRFVPEHSFPLQNAAPRSEISTVFEIGLRVVPL